MAIFVVQFNRIMKVYFHLRDKTVKSTSVIICTRWKGITLRITTHIKIKPREWSDANLIKSTVSNYVELNDYLRTERQDIETAMTTYLKKYGDYPTTLEKFKKHLSAFRIDKSEQDNSDQNNLFNFANKLINEHKVRLENDGKKIDRNSHVQSLEQTIEVLEKFVEDVKFNLDFQTVDLDFYFEFIDWCATVKKYKRNNTGKHVKNLKSIMNEAVDRDLTDNLKFKSKKFKVFNDEVYNVYLNEQELNSLFELDLKATPHLEKTRDLFLVGCGTGLRISDYGRIQKEHVHKDEDGNPFIKITTRKDGSDIEIPLEKRTISLLEKYDYSTPKMPEQNLNKYIKKVCQMAGITQTESFEFVKGKKVARMHEPKFEMISSHTARRSFSTNLYKREVPAITIMAITGHKTESSFMRYLKPSPADNRKQLKKHYDKKEPQMKIA